MKLTEHLTRGEPMDIVRRQVGLGPRWPGSPGHRALLGALADCLRRHADRFLRQDFFIAPGGRRVACANLIGCFRGRTGGGALLLGSHFDTRPRADREESLERRRRPIPGANDGGSGTAVLLHLLPRLRARAPARDLLIAFFDAEDMGGIEGLPFALGARIYLSDPALPRPEEALILDMVGGKNMRLTPDAHIRRHPPSLELTRRIIGIGKLSGYPCFTRAGGERPIISDQYPFLKAGIASCLLIDLDYPAWHTLDDLPAAMAEESLAMIEAVLWRYLSESRG